jgi:hypothetical protein
MGYVDGLVNAAKIINGLFIFGVLLAGSVVVAKVVRAGEVEVLGQKIPLKLVWAVFVAVTLLHCVFAWIFVRNVNDVMRMDDMYVLIAAWQGVAKGGYDLIFFRDFGVRDVGLLAWLLGITYGHIEDDPAFLLHLMAAALVFAALVKWPSKGGSRVPSLLIAITFVVGNWVIASQWAARFSDLTVAAAKVPREIVKEVLRSGK